MDSPRDQQRCSPCDPGTTDPIQPFAGNHPRECHSGESPALGKTMFEGYALDLTKVKLTVCRQSATEELVRPHRGCGQSARQGMTTEPNGE